jgi:glycosyltransferase involved in cell wall biosynthesis
MRSISAIIPVYNSEATLSKVVERLLNVLSTLTAEYEVILVDDSSRDASWQVVQNLAEQHPQVHGIQLMRNFGQHNALLCGIRAARYEICLTLDDDGQNPPEEIPALVSKLEEGFDVVYGYPRKEQHGLWRDLSSVLMKVVLANIMGAETARHASPFRAFRTRCREGFANFQGPQVSIEVLLTWGASRFTYITVDHSERIAGASNYTFQKLLRLALTMLTGFSVLPLQIASMAGFASIIFGFFVLIYVIIRFIIQGGVVPGFSFLASTIAIFSGVQLFSLGIIGEYLARMHFRMMDKPPYAVAETTSPPKVDK